MNTDSNLSIDRSQLLKVKKPGQYLGGEHNSILKDLKNIDVRFALAFPDLYEVGMSHVGIQLLYEIINAKDNCWAERVFMPMADMESLLRERKQALASLESATPLGEFDFLGFSLQYELCATNILTMLDLAGIPFRAEDRDESQPIVIGGGPYTYHPEPLSPFFDAFFLGDAEEAMEEILAVKANWNKRWENRESEAKGQDISRARLLQELAEVEGIYIPSLYSPSYDPVEKTKFTGYKSTGKAPQLVTRRLLPTMEGAPYLKKPIVPNIETVHNRLSVEVMRGCVRGCRFCQAGYLYRPQRERSPEEIVEIIGESLPQSGYEELSLLSLSTADYCSIVPLLKTLMDSYAKDDKLAVSFPSTRVDSLTPEVLEQVQRVRRTGFTIAPEGGTQRIRDVINKGVSDEQILETCSNVFKMGWSGIKLYFMLGLPTETDEDLLGIVDIAKRINNLPEARQKTITVSVSTHVPKPHTPFQWAQQVSPEETIRKQRLINEGLKKSGINFRYHNAFSSFLEGVFCRGDRELAPVVERAWELGCRLDAWSESLESETWMQAFSDCNVNPYLYLHEKNPADAMPWDHLSCGIPKSYFLKEWKRAIRFRNTPDCLTQSCSVCGACNYDTARNVLWPRSDTPNLAVKMEELDAAQVRESSGPLAKSRFRLRYSRAGGFAMIGHLELSHVFHRATRRAGIPLAYSRGFHPHPKLVFGPPLQLGTESLEEYLDAYLSTNFEPELLKTFLNQELPKGLEITECEEINMKASSLGKELKAFDYRISWISEPGGLLLGLSSVKEKDLPSIIEQILSCEVVRKGKLRKPNKAKKGQKRKYPKKVKDKVLLVRDSISDISFVSSEKQTSPDLCFRLNMNPEGASIRVTELVQKISGLEAGDYRAIKIRSILSPDENTEAKEDKEPLQMLA